MARHCSVCGQVGHYSKTCTKSSNVPAEVKPNNVSSPEEKETVLTSQPTTDVITTEERTIYLKPKKGLWLINLDRKRVSGRVAYVKGNGQVVIEEVYGAYVEMDPKVISDSGYVFCELEPKMLTWWHH